MFATVGVQLPSPVLFDSLEVMMITIVLFATEGVQLASEEVKWSTVRLLLAILVLLATV